MKKRIIVILTAMIMMTGAMMTGCGDALNGAPPQETAAKAEIGAEVIDTAVIQAADGNVRTAVRTKAGQATEEFEDVRESEEVQEQGETREAEEAREMETAREPEEAREPGEVQEHEGVRESEKVREPEEVCESEEVQESVTAPPHVCSVDSGNTITILAFGQQEPNCFYGAKYDVKCGDCGEYLDVIYREPLGHTGDEGEVTCQPDCTGGGSIKYTCIRCGAEWSEEYGQIQPHAWVEGVKKVTDWENGGTKEIPYLYCSVCGVREGSE